MTLVRLGVRFAFPPSRASRFFPLSADRQMRTQVKIMTIPVSLSFGLAARTPPVPNATPYDSAVYFKGSQNLAYLPMLDSVLILPAFFQGSGGVLAIPRRHAADTT
jgi:hypothetical protein